MIERFVSFLASIPGRAWRATGGRLLAAQPPPVVPVQPVIQPDEPRSVAGITLRASLVVIGVVLVAYLTYQLRQLLVLVFLAILLAAGIYGVIRFFERYVPRIVAVLISYGLLIGVLALTLFLIFPPLVRQAVEFADDLPARIEQLRTGAIELIDSIAGTGRGEEIIDSLTGGAEDALPEIGSILSVPLTVLGIFANLFIVVFLSALMLIERDRARGYLLNFVKDQDREAVTDTGRRALLKLGAYVRGQLLVMTLIGAGSALGLVVVGFLLNGEPLPFVIPLGALSFITAAIPLAGAFIAGGPIVLVALTVEPVTGVLMALWLVVLQQLEGSVITPFIQGRVVNLSAIAVLLGVVACTSIAGIVGGIIAIPLVAVADVILRDIVFPLRRRAAARRRGVVEPSEAPAL
jgi:predicted PurR-regulated permease PerM